MVRGIGSRGGRVCRLGSALLVLITAGCWDGPPTLSYPNPETYTVGVAISSLDPTVTGTISKYSVSPALPAGLSIDTATGVISGTPTSVTAGSLYTVTATYASGSTSFSISIQVVAPAGPSSNVESIVLDRGPSALTIPVVNTAFVSIKICAPGSSTNCQTIDHVKVDTGSVGLRIIAGAAIGSGGGELTALTLPAAVDASGNPLAECVHFADGWSWGSIATADITLPVSGESASGVNIQVISATSAGDPSAASPSCVPAVLMTKNTVASFGANGTLGVGLFLNDCLTTSTCEPGGSATYYSCPKGGVCTQTTTSSVAQLVPNPVSKFPKDNNGVILELPTVSDSGAANPSGGQLIFGIGTESNNGLGSATQLPANPTSGHITAMLNGSTLIDSYFDSGSNGIFFPSSLPVCTPNNGFYCPTAATAENAILGSSNVAANFAVANAASLFTNTSLTAFNNLGGPNPDLQSLDLGLPFFFGKKIYIGFANPSTGTTPYFAY